MFSFFKCCRQPKNDRVYKEDSQVSAFECAKLLARSKDNESDSKIQLDKLHSLLPKVNLNARDKNGWTLFHRVVFAESKQFNPRGDHKLDRNSLTQEALRLAADPNLQTQDKLGFTALHIAAHSKNDAMYNLICAFGGDDMIRDNKNRQPQSFLSPVMK